VHVLGDGFCGALYIADIRLLVFVQRGGNGNGHRIHALNKGKVAGGGKSTAFDYLLQRVADNIADIILSGIDRINLLGLNVKTDGTVTGFRKFNGKRKPDISQADNADNSGFVLNFIQ